MLERLADLADIDFPGPQVESNLRGLISEAQRWDDIRRKYPEQTGRLARAHATGAHAKRPADPEQDSVAELWKTVEAFRGYAKDARFNHDEQVTLSHAGVILTSALVAANLSDLIPADLDPTYRTQES